MEENYCLNLKLNDYFGIHNQNLCTIDNISTVDYANDSITAPFYVDFTNDRWWENIPACGETELIKGEKENNYKFKHRH